MDAIILKLHNGHISVF